jgi:hypothetical protein
MDTKEILASILLKNIPKHLEHTYREIKERLNECSAITEVIDLSKIKEEYWAQTELNPLYENENQESGVSEIVCDFFINDGKITLTTTVCFPQIGTAYCGDSIFDASGSKLPEKYCSIRPYDG